MTKQDVLAQRFEAQRAHLRAVGYRMLGSASDAEDAVQETWLRLDRADVRDVQNLAGWLTTVLARICLDMLRLRDTRREQPHESANLDRGVDHGTGADHEARTDPEQEAVLADSVGRALLVVLDRLSPAERVALVLHDMFAVPFEEIAAVVDRSPVAAKKLASRARQRVKGHDAQPAARLTEQRHVVQAFLAAARGGDIGGLLAVLAPDVIRRADPAALPAGLATEIRGAQAVIAETVVIGRQATEAELALVDGAVGVVVAPHGRLRLVLSITINDGLITGYDVIAEPARIAQLSLTVLDY
jgi:RNA polymerase sigma factor (sigma-70 family)